MVRPWAGPAGGRGRSWAGQAAGPFVGGAGGPEVARRTDASRTHGADPVTWGPRGGGLVSVPSNPHPLPSRRPGRWWPACCCAPGSGALQLARGPCVGPLARARGPASTCSAASCPPCTTRTACPGEPGFPVPAALQDRPQPSLPSVTHDSYTGPASTRTPSLGRCRNTQSGDTVTLRVSW